MSKSKALEILILGLWLLVVATLVVRHVQSERQIDLPADDDRRSRLEENLAGSLFDVRRIVVVDGNTYDLTLKDNDKRILIELDVAAVPDIKQKITALLNKSSSPKVKLKTKRPDGRWSASITLKVEGRDVDLSSWLAENKLVYQ